MIRLLLDMGLPRRAAIDLRAQGWDVYHAAEIGMAMALDTAILEKAAADDRVVVTLDSDFARLVAVGGLAKPSLVHLRLQRVNRQVALKLLAEILPRLREDLAQGCIASVTKGGVRVRRLPVRR